MKTIYTKRNLLISLVLALVGVVFYYLIKYVFKSDEADWMFYLLMYFTFFLINFVVGNGNRPWKDFLTLKTRND
jgi:hypothetical protein